MYGSMSFVLMSLVLMSLVLMSLVLMSLVLMSLFRIVMSHALMIQIYNHCRENAVFVCVL